MMENLFSEKGSKTAWGISLRFCSSISASDLDEFLFSVAVPFHLNRVPSNGLLTSWTEIVPNRSCGLSPSEEKVSTKDTGRYAHSDPDQAKDKPG